MHTRFVHIHVHKHNIQLENQLPYSRQLLWLNTGPWIFYPRKKQPSPAVTSSNHGTTNILTPENYPLYGKAYHGRSTQREGASYCVEELLSIIMTKYLHIWCLRKMWIIKAPRVLMPRWKLLMNNSSCMQWCKRVRWSTVIVAKKDSQNFEVQNNNIIMED